MLLGICNCRDSPQMNDESGARAQEMLGIAASQMPSNAEAWGRW
jgi:hypothetical protein